MAQTVQLLGTLVHEPRLIILDEPTNGLDPAGQLEIRELIRTLAHAGRTIFLSSHMLHEIEQICDRVAILKQGKLIAQGGVAELLRRGRGVQVRISGDPAAALELLRAQPWVGGVRQSGEQAGAPPSGAGGAAGQVVLLIDAPTERAAEINALLTNHAIAVAEIRAHEERLEDFFLEVTRAEE
jgi:ABC-2 type transport system ATP-binding protein